MTIATSPKLAVTLDRTNLIRLVFRYLRAFFNVHLGAQKELAITIEPHHDDPRKSVRGLGLAETMDSHGFGWFAPIVDWEHLRFHDTLASSILSVDRNLVAWFDDFQTHQLFDRASDLDLLVTWVPLVHDVRRREQLCHIIAHLLCQQYRRDALSHVASRKQLVLNVDEGEDMDDVRFCWDHFAQYLRTPPRLQAGNRTTFKAPRQLFTWIWGPSESDLPHPTYNRLFWDHSPFRLWHNKIIGYLASHPLIQQELNDILYNVFFRFHWLVFVPDKGGSFLSTKNGEPGTRLFYQTAWGYRKLGKAEKKNTRATRPPHKEWTWVEYGERRGIPDDYPAELSMSLSELREIYGPR
jgi:hypothetical protein